MPRNSDDEGSDNINGSGGATVVPFQLRLDANAAARWYIARGYSVIPIPHGQKGPTARNWQRMEINLTNVDQYFPLGQLMNIGVKQGGPRGDSDADLDCQEAVRLAPYFLPQTNSVFGRASKPKSHYLYRVPDAIGLNKASEPFKDETGAMINELRLGQGGRAAQTVFPWSTHPSGELIEWDQNGRGEPATVSYAELRKRISRLAAAVMVMRAWPMQGGRHEAALVMGAFMARAGLTVDEAIEFITAIAAECGDNEVSDRTTAVRNSFEAHERGDQTYGMPKLVEWVGDDKAKLIAKYMGYEEVQSDEILERMNEQYCVIALNGKMRVLEWQEMETGIAEPVFYRIEDFKSLHNHTKIGRAGKATWWLGQPQRRQYRRIVFKPGSPNVLHDGKDLNLWRGFAIEPREGNWNLMQEHIHNVLAGGDTQMAEYIIKWAAWAIQHPGERAEVALVFIGEEGTGKGMFARCLVKVFGRHGKQISEARHLVGTFNAHFMDCALLFADEAYWPGNKGAEGNIKRMLTEETLFVEPKGIDGFEVYNALHVVMATNHDWVVPASATARRFAVSNVSNEYIQNDTYFTALSEQMNGGGMAAMLYDLKAMDLGRWHPRYNIPKTIGLRQQQALSLQPMAQWWLELIREGEVPTLVDSDKVPTHILFEDARRAVPRLRDFSDGDFGRFLMQCGCIKVRFRDGSRTRGWQLPTLAATRLKWQRSYGPQDWAEGAVWVERPQAM